MAAVFAEAGFAPVAPPIIQPAGRFLDRVGEDIRTRTYVFTDPDGAELCLRPDLTVPVVAQHIASGAATPARYSYAGPAFRFQPAGAEPLRPREFAQVGIEHLGPTDDDAADAQILALVARALVEAARQPGEALQLRLGNVALFRAVLAALEMPQRWRQRLAAAFWQPRRFAALLARLAAPSPPLPSSLMRLADAVRDEPVRGGEQVAQYCAAAGIAVIGRRKLADVAAALAAAAEDCETAPLPHDLAALIAQVPEIEGRAEDALTELDRLAAAHELPLRPALEAEAARHARFVAAGVPMTDAIFDAGFGRNLEYYTGFVFQFERPGQPAVALAGGGRYDGLIAALGGPAVGAVGAAVHPERLA